MSTQREALLAEARRTRSMDGAQHLRNLLLHTCEEFKEQLLTTRGERAEQMRGFVHHLRLQLKAVDADKPESRRSNPYA